VKIELDKRGQTIDHSLVVWSRAECDAARADAAATGRGWISLYGGGSGPGFAVTLQEIEEAQDRQVTLADIAQETERG
jgi:hypothetical protein